MTEEVQALREEIAKLRERVAVLEARPIAPLHTLQVGPGHFSPPAQPLWINPSPLVLQPTITCGTISPPPLQEP